MPPAVNAVLHADSSADQGFWRWWIRVRHCCGKLRDGFSLVREGQAKTEPIDAALSKSLLTTVAAGDWTKFPYHLGNLRPPNLLDALGVTGKDGWKPPATPGWERREAAALQ